jgi:hypothetical protein
LGVKENVSVAVSRLVASVNDFAEVADAVVAAFE